MNSRRFMGFPQRQGSQTQYSRSGCWFRAVHCSKTRPLMSELGQSLPARFASRRPDVRFAPNSDQNIAAPRLVAMCRLCCKSRFALVIKNSAGCRRDFRVRT